MAEQQNYSGIEVIIRLKPILGDADVDTRSCVTISPTEDNTVVVETPSKKEFFSFDHVAGEHCQQSDIYDCVGRPVLAECLKGYNCCVFAYGQTGAGKTFSILGDATELAENGLADSRGVLPRLLEDLFTQLQRLGSKFSAKCSYLEIYNEQIIDLLNKEIKVYPIRQDCKKGVYVQGLSEEPIASYDDSLQHIFKGLKNRKVASTSMNSESSRSHSIFTINIRLQAEEDGVQIERFSKVHVVDLAGSERQRQVNVSGERLKEGCNINRSLHCLGNVINSLVESIKKKKYVPFRDSKLTFFLKDSLGGNSKTKLLANINPRRLYLGDTISTLMFAKRAKILKVRVQPNQTVTDNFEALRSEIRKLREQLSQTKFIKNPMEVSKIEEEPRQIESDRSLQREKVRVPQTSPTSKNQIEMQQSLDVFVQNEKSYRMIIALYEQRLARMQLPVKVEANFKHLFEQKRLLEKQNNAYAGLAANFPAFTQIFKDNLQLKRKVKQLQQELVALSKSKQEMFLEAENLRNNVTILKEQRDGIEADMMSYRQEVDHVISTSMIKEDEGDNKGDFTAVLPLLELSRLQDQAVLNMTKRQDVRDMLMRQNNMLEEYQLAIEELKAKFSQHITQLQENYDQLEHLYEQQKQEKATMRKMKRPEQSPAVQTLQNQNEYLKLNVMELETEIGRYEELSFRNGVEIKTLQEENAELAAEVSQLKNTAQKQSIQEQQLVELFNKLREIKQAAQRQNKQIESERDRDDSTYSELKQRLLKLSHENAALLEKHKSLVHKNRQLKKRLGQSTSKSTTIEAGSDDVSLQDDCGSLQQASSQKLQQLTKEVQQLQKQKESLLKQLQQQGFKNTEDRSKLQRASMRILCLSKESAWLKQQSHHEQEQVRLMQAKIEQSENSLKNLREKLKLAEIENNRTKKELEKREQLSARIRTETHKSEFELLESYKLMESQIQFLKQEVEKSRHESRPKSGTGYYNSSRSLKTLNRLKEQTPNQSTVQPFSLGNTQSSVDRKEPKSTQKKERQNSLNAPNKQAKNRVDSIDLAKSQPLVPQGTSTNPSQFVGPFSKSKRAVVIPVPPALPKKK